MKISDLREMSNWAAIDPRLLITGAIVIFILGWLFPVEGPFDWTYDKFAKSPAVHRPSKCCAAPAPKKKEIFEDFNEDGEPEWYQLVPMFEVKNEE